MDSPIDRQTEAEAFYLLRQAGVQLDHALTDPQSRKAQRVPPM